MEMLYFSSLYQLMLMYALKLINVAECIPMEKLNDNEFIFDIRVTNIPPQVKSVRKNGKYA